jgi:hypothetical protein
MGQMLSWPLYAKRTVMLADTNQQAGKPICTPVCARDVAGQAETGEMQKAFGDYMQQVSRGQRGDWRLPETAGTNVVWLITQRSRVQIPPPLPGKTALQR